MNLDRFEVVIEMSRALLQQVRDAVDDLLLLRRSYWRDCSHVIFHHQQYRHSGVCRNPGVAQEHLLLAKSLGTGLRQCDVMLLRNL